MRACVRVSESESESESERERERMRVSERVCVYMCEFQGTRCLLLIAAIGSLQSSCTFSGFNLICKNADNSVLNCMCKYAN